MRTTSSLSMNVIGKNILLSANKGTSDKGHLEELLKLNELAEILSIKEPDEALKHTDEVIRKGVEHYQWREVAKAYNTRGTAYWYKSNYAGSIASQEQALEIWKSLSDGKGIGKSLIGLGNASLRRGDFHIALTHLQHALQYFEDADDAEGIASIYNNIGVIYKNWGDYEKATIFYHRALEIKEKNKTAKGSIANSYNNIGILYFFQENYSKALEYIQVAEKINRDCGNVNALAGNYTNIALIHNREGHHDTALEYLAESLKIKEELGDKLEITVAYREIGEVHKQQGKYDEALNSYLKGLAIREEIDSRHGIGFFCNRVGETFMLIGKFDEAITYLERGLKINLEIGSKEFIKESHQFLSKTHALKGDYKKAYDYLSEFISVKGELFNEERTKAINEVQAKYEAEKKDLEIEKLNMEQQHLSDINDELELFAGKAAHDLKEPLRMMSSYSGLLNMRYAENLDEDGREYVDIIQSAAKRMSKLLNGLLDYARSGAANVRKEDIDLNDILAHIEHNLQLTVKETGAQIVYNELPTVYAAPSAMLQLFQNIIANGIKFQKKDTLPIVKITCQKQKSTYLFSIADNGIGIPDDQQEQVFEIFRRLNSRKHYSGCGIGLATCKKIIEGLGGKIWLESTHEIGTTFYFTIPFAV